MKNVWMEAPIALACLCGLALAQTVTYNYDRGSDFSKYKAYKWVQIKESNHPNELVDKQIKAAVDSQLATKGLTKTDSEQADLYVGYQVGVDKEKSISAYSMGGGPWGGGARWGGGMTTATTSTIQVGQLVLDMYDPSTKQMVWRAMGSKELDPTAKPEKRQENLNKGVAKLLKNYPPKMK
jgi:hypothetical protein